MFSGTLKHTDPSQLWEVYKYSSFDRVARTVPFPKSLYIFFCNSTREEALVCIKLESPIRKKKKTHNVNYMFLFVLLYEAVLIMGSARSLCKQYDPFSPTFAQIPWMMNTCALLPSESFPQTKTQDHLPFSVLGTLEGLLHPHLPHSPPDSLKRRHKLIQRTEQAVMTFLFLPSRLQLQPGSSHSIRHRLSCLCWALHHSWWGCLFKRDLREVF